MRDWTGAPEIQSISDFQARKVTERIDYYLRDLSRGVGRIQQGEIPDGSGTLITDVKISDIYWVLLGRSGGQTGFGGTGPSQNARIASTTDATKGLIYLGMANLAAFDETNTRLGMGTTAATAKVHIKVAAPSFVTTVRPQGDVATANWVNTTGGLPVAPHLGGTTTATYARGVEISPFGSLIVSATGTDPGTVSGWNVGFSGRVLSGPPGFSTLTINMDSGGLSWFNSGAQNITSTTTFQDFIVPVASASASAAVFSNLRFGVLYSSSPGFTEIQVANVRLLLPAAGGVSDDLLQKWDATTTTATLNFGDSGASTVDMDFIGNMPVMRTNGDLSSGLRTYASSSAFWVEAGTTAQSAMNLVFAGNRQATGVSARFQFASATFTSALQALQVGIGAPPSASPAIALDVTGRTRFVTVVQSFINNQSNYDIGNSTILRLTNTSGSNQIRGFTNGVDGRVVIVVNDGATNNIVLAHDTIATAANRFFTSTKQNITLTPGQAVICVYDGTISRWRVSDWMVPNGQYIISGSFEWDSTLIVNRDASGNLNIEGGLPGTKPQILFTDTGTSNTLTLAASAAAFTGANVLTMPDRTDVIVTRNATETLTNKTFTSATIASSTIASSTIASSTIVSGTITSATITASIFNAGTIASSTFSSGTISSATITANDPFVIAGASSVGFPRLIYLETLTNSMVALTPTTAVGGTVTLTVPAAASDTIVVRNATETLANKTMAKTTRLVVNAQTDGAFFADETSTGKRFRHILSGVTASSQNAIQFFNSASRLWTVSGDYDAKFIFAGVSSVASGSGTTQGTLGFTSLTGLSASLGTTTLASAVGGGLYRVPWYVKVTTVGDAEPTDSLQASATWNDGTSQTQILIPMNVTAAADLDGTMRVSTANKFFSGEIVVSAVASSNISIQTTLVNAGATNPVYSLAATVESI